jgi:signal transduction histidine kinase
VASGTLELEPHFQQTPGFKVLVALGIGLLALGAYQVRARQWRAETMVLAERNRLAREIHDGLTQSLTGILIQLEAAVVLWAEKPDGSRPHVERAREWARHSLAEARMAVSSLRRDVASMEALSQALRRCAEVLTEGTSVRAEVKMAGDALLPPAVGAALLRIGQEAMTNAVRHGQPRLITVSVDLLSQGGELRLAVKDDGRGFDASRAASSTSNGLRNMRERAEAIAALCELHSAPGNGTEVSVQVPLGPRGKDPLRKT